MPDGKPKTRKDGSTRKIKLKRTDGSKVITKYDKAGKVKRTRTTMSNAERRSENVASEEFIPQAKKLKRK